MPISVRVQLVPVLRADGSSWLTILARTNEGTGHTDVLPWNSAFSVEHIIVFDTLPRTLAPSHKTIKRLSKKQERRIAEGVGGKAQTGSGSRPGYKGDGRVAGRFRIENKLTFKDSYRVTLADLHKIRSECDGFETPVFEVEFLSKDTHMLKEAWVLVPQKEWEKLANAAPSDR